MRLPVILLRRGDIAGILLAVAILAIVLYVSVISPGSLAQHMNGSGPGPGWVCQSVPQGEPVCVKDVQKRQAN